MVVGPEDPAAVVGQQQATKGGGGGSNGTMGASVPVVPEPSSFASSCSLPAGSPAQKQVASHASSNSPKNSWKLKYQDFIPSKTGSKWSNSENFQ